jgi:uncharacterized protein
MKVLISGGSGLIGRELCIRLQEKGYEVAILSRNKTYYSGPQTYKWDLENGSIETGAIETSDFIIHLAGANISEKRWNEKRKQVIIDSRVKGINLLFDKIKTARNKPQAFITSSAVNYYGTLTRNTIFTEDYPPGGDFLGEVCRKWEEAATQMEMLQIRTVKIRTGIVLSDKGGALKKMLLPVNLGLSAPIGSGDQYFPWIHIDDLCQIYIKAIEDQAMTGAYNAVAPGHTTNHDFMKTLAGVREKPFWAPRVPSYMLKLFLGEMAQMLLNGSRISSEKIIKTGFSFKFDSLPKALKDLVGV